MASKNQEVTGVKRVVGFLVAMIIVGVTGAFLFHKKDVSEQSYVVGIASPGRGMNDSVKGFVEGMKKYGFEEGKNVTYIIHEDKAGVDDALNAMMKKNVDLIFTMTTPITKKAKVKTAESKVPVVFIMHDPVATGIIDSLVKPGGNLTGIQVHGDAPKALEWLQLIVPDVKNVYAPIGHKNMASFQSLKDLHEAGKQLKVAVVSERVETKEELEVALNNMPENVDAIFALHSVVIISNIEMMAKIALKKKIPIISLHHNKEATITFGVDGYEAGIKASRLASQIFQDVQPADIPTELADFHLGINLQNARQIGLPVSNEMLLQVDDVIR